MDDDVFDAALRSLVKCGEVEVKCGRCLTRIDDLSLCPLCGPIDETDDLEFRLVGRVLQ